MLICIHRSNGPGHEGRTDEAQDDWQDRKAEEKADDDDQKEDLEEDNENVRPGIGQQNKGQKGGEAATQNS